MKRKVLKPSHMCDPAAQSRQKDHRRRAHPPAAAAMFAWRLLKGARSGDSGIVLAMVQKSSRGFGECAVLGILRGSGRTV